MSALPEVQAWLAQVLRQRRSIPNDAEASRLAAVHATGNDRLSPAEQVEIYREQFWLRHTTSLVDDYAGLSGILGQSDWERLAEEYLEAHPPRSVVLRDLGDRLPAFVGESAWLPHHELCVDMARLEWAYVEVFDAEEVPPLDPAELARIPENAWETARLEPNPALRLLHVRYPVAELRKRIRGNEPNVPIPERQPQNLVIYRGADRNLYHDEVDDGAFAVLETLAAGTPLVAACQRAIERTSSTSSEIEERLGAWFQDWSARAWIVGVTLQSTRG